MVLETWQFPQPRCLYEYCSAQFFISRRLAKGLEHADQQPFSVPQIADVLSWCLSGSDETMFCTSSKLEHRRVHPFGVTAHYSGPMCDITSLTPRDAGLLQLCQKLKEFPTSYEICFLITIWSISAGLPLSSDFSISEPSVRIETRLTDVSSRMMTLHAKTLVSARERSDVTLMVPRVLYCQQM